MIQFFASTAVNLAITLPVLLVIFMVTAPFILQSVKVKLPQNSPVTTLKPAPRNGQPVSAWIDLPVLYRLSQAR